MATLPDAHLDLGCGKHPRNPYLRSRVCGVDIRALSESMADSGFEFRAANLSVEPIPWADDSFGSVSAFDFIEHVPRILPTPDGRDTIFPFVRLMDEIWRVLAPGGVFYALTPTWPAPEVFVDPTHVNFITEHTHDYFCGESPLARMYGFRGKFIVRRAHWTQKLDALSAVPGAELPLPALFPSIPRTPRVKQIAHAVRDAVRWIRRKGPNQARAVPPRMIYFLWELEVVK